MSTTSDFYMARAQENAQAARDTNLVNVRERCLRAEAAWLTMANRLLRIEQQKRKDETDKAASTVEAPAVREVPWPIAPMQRARPKG